MSNRSCIVCHGLIVGRADKKYCSDQCRTIHNNHKKSIDEQTITEINKGLRKNRTILKTLSPAGKTIVNKLTLQSAGFRFHLFTSILVTNEKKIYYICYDVAYTPIHDEGSEKALIVSWTEYRKEWDPWKFAAKQK